MEISPNIPGIYHSPAGRESHSTGDLPSYRTRLLRAFVSGVVFFSFTPAVTGCEDDRPALSDAEAGLYMAMNSADNALQHAEDDLKKRDYYGARKVLEDFFQGLTWQSVRTDEAENPRIKDLEARYQDLLLRIAEAEESALAEYTERTNKCLSTLEKSSKSCSQPSNNIPVEVTRVSDPVGFFNLCANQDGVASIRLKYPSDYVPGENTIGGKVVFTSPHHFTLGNGDITPGCVPAGSSLLHLGSSATISIDSDTIFPGGDPGSKGAIVRFNGAPGKHLPVSIYTATTLDTY